MTTPTKKTKPTPAAQAFRFVRIAAFAFAPTLAVPGLATNKAALIAGGAAALETAFRTLSPTDDIWVAKVVKSVLKFAPEAAALVASDLPQYATEAKAAEKVVTEVATVAQTAETAATPEVM